jgi:hypothetical protein
MIFGIRGSGGMSAAGLCGENSGVKDSARLCIEFRTGDSWKIGKVASFGIDGVRNEWLA